MKIFNSPRLLVLQNLSLSFLLALFLGAICYPEFWIFPKVSYFNVDHYVDFLGSFALTNFFYQGHIQLWDNYDQMPWTYLCLTDGLYKFPSILTAAVYALFSFLTTHPAELFFKVYSNVHFLIMLFFRLLGCYFLLERFCQRRWLLVLATAYVSIIISPHFFLIGVTYQSLYPLLLHLTLKFFEEWKVKDLLLSLLYFILCLSYGVMQGGYMYQGIHLFMIAAFIWSYVTHRISLNNFKTSTWVYVGITLLFALIIMAPYIYMLKYSLTDYSYGYENSRLTHIWSFSNYFHRPNIAMADATEFLWRSIDYTNMGRWGESWAFIGFSTLAFALIGAVWGRDSRRHIFTGAIFLIWCLNNPRDSFPFGLLGHWVNALTNILKFIPRSLHMCSVMIVPYLLAPLVLMGVEALWHAIQTRQAQNQHKLKHCRLLILLLLLLCITPCIQFPLITGYVLTSGSILAIVLLMAFLKIKYQQWRPIAFALIASVFVIDAFLMLYYVKNGCDYVKPQVIEGRPELNSVGIDFQNPRILPFRSFYDTFNYSTVNHYLITSHNNTPGIFFRYTNMMRNFYWTNNHMPRHMSYASWQQDRPLWYYIQEQRQMIFLAHDAVQNSDSNFIDIVQHGLTNDVIMLDQAALPSTVPLIRPSPPAVIPFKLLTYPLKSATLQREKDLLILGYKLPDTFPRYLATTFLTMDSQYLRLSLSNQPNLAFAGIQGQIVLPYSFDINNIRDGWLYIGMPAGTSIKDGNFNLVYPNELLGGITKIWQNESDRFGFDLQTPKNAWLVFHYPYDTKWQLTVDGRITPLERANKYFMAAYLNAGHHSILLEYWPHTPLRWMIILSMIVASLGLLILLYFVLSPSTKP